MKLNNTLLFSIALVTLIGFTNCQAPKDKASDESQTEENSMMKNDEKDHKPDPEMLEAFIALGVNVEKGIPEGLKIGASAPLFKEKDVNGNLVDLEALLKEGPVVLQFYRGQWCPVCNRYLSAFQDSLSLIEAKGAKVIAIAPETAENAFSSIEKSSIGYPVISDRDNKIMDAYKVTFEVTDAYVERIKKGLKADIAENNGSPTAKLPVPATYVIKQDVTVSYVQFDINYKHRASVKDILAHL